MKKYFFKSIWVVSFLLHFSFSAMAEENKVPADITRESVEFIMDQNMKLNSVGYRVLTALPPRGDGLHEGALPFSVFPLNKKIQEIYKTVNPEGVIVAGDILYANYHSKLKRGDEIVKYQGIKIQSMNQLTGLVRKTTNTSSRVKFRRQDQEWEEEIPIYHFSYSAQFAVFDGLYYSDWLDAITLSTALLKTIENEDGMAYVLAHEIAHKMLGHVRGPVQINKTDVIIERAVAGVMSKLLNTELYSPSSDTYVPAGPYQIHDEVEADYIALSYLFQAGYDPAAAISFLERLEVEENPKTAGLSTRDIHPLNVDRIALVKKKLDELEAIKGQELQEFVPHDKATHFFEEKLGPDLSTGADPSIAGIINIGLKEWNENYSRNSNIEKDTVIFVNGAKIEWYAKCNQPSFRDSFRSWHVEWYLPSGKLYQNEKIYFESGQYLKSTITLKENDSSMIGRWKIRALWNRHLIDERYFLVQDSRASFTKKRSEILKEKL